MGRRCVEFVSARDAGHGGGVRVLAGQADLERALRGGGHSRRARLTGRHHLAERWALVAGRRLFAVRLARHRPRMDTRSELGSPDQKSSDACRMVMQTPASSGFTARATFRSLHPNNLKGSSKNQEGESPWRASTTTW